MRNWKRLPTILRLTLGMLCLGEAAAQTPYHDFEAPPHRYWERTPTDRFTQLKDGLESGALPLDRTSEKAFLTSLLAALEIPASSQTLVFSTTSLQLSLISPRNPRALYFNEDVYIGHVPGGRIEVVSLDPELGAIFYIFEQPLSGRPMKIERSARCMNCHADEQSGFVPGLVLKSVVPGPRGGSLTSYRAGRTGHDVSLADRFGGWHVTGAPAFTNHWGNLTGRLDGDVLTTFPNPPGERFSFDKYPVATSDLLPLLVFEHQAGFVNRVVEAGYRARTILHTSNGALSREQSAELDEQARSLTRYLLFADEALLPEGGFAGDASFRRDFLSRRKATADGLSLRDLDLKTRLFRHRCSYMIYSAVFAGLPEEMKQRIYRELAAALSVDQLHPDYAYLPAAEKQTIRRILRETLAGLPGGW